jgi:hypothetical protein
LIFPGFLCLFIVPSFLPSVVDSAAPPLDEEKVKTRVLHILIGKDWPPKGVGLHCFIG